MSAAHEALARTVQVRRRTNEISDTPQYDWQSGYLLTDAVVLTAAHGVGERETLADVRLASSDDWRPCKVAWRRRADKPFADIALLQLSEPVSLRGPPAVLRRRPDRDVAARTIGYPEITITRGQGRDTLKLDGIVAPEGGAETGKLQFTISNAPPVEDMSGLSGAAILTSSNDLLGVVAKAPESWSMVWASPVSALQDDPEAAVFLPALQATSQDVLRLLEGNNAVLKAVASSLGDPALSAGDCAQRIAGRTLTGVVELVDDLLDLPDRDADGLLCLASLLLRDAPDLAQRAAQVREALDASGSGVIEIDADVHAVAELSLCNVKSVEPEFVLDDGFVFGESTARVPVPTGALDERGEEFTRRVAQDLETKTGLDLWRVTHGLGKDVGVNVAHLPRLEDRFLQLNVRLARLAKSRGKQGKLPIYFVLANRFLGQDQATTRTWTQELSNKLTELKVIWLNGSDGRDATIELIIEDVLRTLLKETMARRHQQ